MTAPTPDRFDDQSDDILLRAGLSPASDKYETVRAAIVSALRSMLPPKGHIIDDGGVVRRVQGTLPILASGEVLGGISDNDYDMEAVWALVKDPFGPSTIHECSAIPRWSDLDDWRMRRKEPEADGARVVHPVSRCYSSKEAAEAASVQPLVELPKEDKQ